MQHVLSSNIVLKMYDNYNTRVFYEFNAFFIHIIMNKIEFIMIEQLYNAVWDILLIFHIDTGKNWYN